MTTLEIRAPAEQEGTRSQILRWLRQTGAAVQLNEPIVELETDKVIVEIAAPGSGVLLEISKQAGDEVAPGEVLGVIDAGGAATVSVSHPAEMIARGREIAARHGGGLQDSGKGAANQLSPAVRRLLNERGLEPTAVLGTGQNGRITVADVMNHVITPSPGAAAPTAERGRMVPHSPIRIRIAGHMVQSLLRTAPHVTTVFDVDMSAVLTHRAKHRDDFEKRGVALTLTAYFLMGAVAALRAVPQANSRWTDTALEIFDHIDIGVATALEPQGLVVPVLRNLESRDLFDIAHALQELVACAREGRLQPAQVRGGTFTISNHGVSGSLLATPIVIHQPQSAILGIGKLEKRAVVIEEGGKDRIVIRPRCYVTLTIDHRVMDGLQANRFLQAFATVIEEWPPG
jgi:2-oxoglutarate dehydrogenase E2 component (dihydrolipoamide succinyltransferase)